MVKPNAWRLLGEQVKTPNGVRDIVPILGAGFNSRCGLKDSWGNLLKYVGDRKRIKIVREIIGSSVNTTVNTTEKWELMVCEHARSGNMSASDAEKALLKDVKNYCKNANARSESRKNISSEFKNFVNLGFRHIVSLNFDLMHNLGLQAKVINNKNDKGKYTETLYRHYDETIKEKPCSLWFPHGDLNKVSTLKLGMMEYGKYIDSIANSIGEYKKYEREVKHKVDFASDKDLDRNMSWTWLFMRQPLLFLGCGLSDAEWTIRWLLIQRKRNFARNEQYKPPVFILADKKSMSKSANYQHFGYHVLLCDEYEKGWIRIYDVLNGSETTTLRT